VRGDRARILWRKGKQKYIRGMRENIDFIEVFDVSQKLRCCSCAFVRRRRT